MQRQRVNKLKSRSCPKVVRLPVVGLVQSGPLVLHFLAKKQEETSSITYMNTEKVNQTKGAGNESTRQSLRQRLCPIVIFKAVSSRQVLFRPRQRSFYNVGLEHEFGE